MPVVRLPWPVAQRVTREYAEYSRDRVGLAGVFAVVVLVGAGTLVLRGGPRWAPIAAVLGTTAWLLALTAARRVYQRSGVVTQAHPRPSRLSRIWAAVPVYLTTATVIGRLGDANLEESDGILYTLGYIGTVLAIPGLFALAWRVMRGPVDSMLTLMVVLGPGYARQWWGEPGTTLNDQQRLAMSLVAGLLVAGLFGALMVESLRQHRAARRLRGRIAALRGKS